MFLLNCPSDDSGQVHGAVPEHGPGADGVPGGRAGQEHPGPESAATADTRPSLVSESVQSRGQPKSCFQGCIHAFKHGKETKRYPEKENLLSRNRGRSPQTYL